MRNITQLTGSEWSKWDLHVHTPASIINHFGGDHNNIWEKYITDLENLPPEFKVLGINDYWFLDGYKRLLKEKEDNNRLQNIELLLPVIEFRIDCLLGLEFGQCNLINLHVIFSNKLPPQTIESQFLNRLSADFKLCNNEDIRWDGAITVESLEDLGAEIRKSMPISMHNTLPTNRILGFNNLALSFDKLKSILETSTYLKDNYIISIGKAEWDDLKWSDSRIAIKKNLINYADIIFTASPSIEKFNSAKKKLKEQNVNDLLLDCSDAHHFSNTDKKDRIGNCHTWIKADPSFEGLKQVLYEPETRIHIGATHPDQKSDYEIIDRIEINHNNIENRVIHFNPNLNTIIGGRSSGKSTLVQCIANKVAPASLKDGVVDPHVIEISETMKVIWRDGIEENSRSVDYFYQGHMYHKSNNEGIESIIESILRQSNNQFYEESENRIANLTQKNAGYLSRLFSKIELINDRKKQAQNIGHREDIQSQIIKLNEHIANSHTTHYPPQEIQNYESKQERLNELKSKQEELQNFYHEIDDITIDHIISINEISSDSPFFDNELRALYSQTLSNIKMTAISEITLFKENVKNRLDNLKKSFDTECQEIEGGETFKKIEAYLKGRENIKPYLERRERELQKLKQLDSLEKEISLAKKEIRKLYRMIVYNWKELNKVAETLKNQINCPSDNSLKIILTPKFDTVRFKEFFTKYINQQSEKAQDHANARYKSAQDLLKDFRQVRNLLQERVIKLKSNFTNEEFMSEFFKTSWFKLYYDISYEGDYYSEMSQGKKAFIVLKLSLEFSNRRCPIIIDQPEDDLDNRAIYTELVSYIKKKKTERQIILVTHNANIVVNADSEQVIVANQHGAKNPNRDNKKFAYKYGSIESNISTPSSQLILESKTIREHICEILEGGDKAFKLREKKYNI